MNTSVLSASIRELSHEEIQLVSGAFSVTDMYASVFAGAVAGAIGGFAIGGLVGAGAGALGGAATGVAATSRTTRGNTVLVD